MFCLFSFSLERGTPCIKQGLPDISTGDPLHAVGYQIAPLVSSVLTILVKVARHT